MTAEERRDPSHHQRLAAAPDRPGERHHDRRGQRHAQAVQAGPADDEAADEARASGKRRMSMPEPDRSRPGNAAPERARSRYPCAASDRNTSRGHSTVAVKIRLMRVGKKKQPTYRVVVADARSPRDGRYHRDHRPLRPAPGAVARRRSTATRRSHGCARAPSRPSRCRSCSPSPASGTVRVRAQGQGRDQAARRGHVTGKVPVPTKAAKPEPAAAAPAAAPAAPAPAAEAAAAEAPAAEAARPSGSPGRGSRRARDGRHAGDG